MALSPSLTRTLGILGIVLLLPLGRSFAGDDKTVAAPSPTPAADKGAPLPLYDVEGNGGILVTQSAYIVDPPRNGQAVGLPSLGAGFISLGNGRYLLPSTITWSPLSRVELGYTLDWFDLGNLPGEVNHALSANIPNSVYLNNFNARFQLIKENEFGQKWLPAFTFGTDYKYNSGISTVNNDLGGALSKIGLPSNQGVDFTLYASKLLTFLPRPVLLDAGYRATRGEELGLLGFSDRYSFVWEANAAVFLTSKLILAGEFRQMPNNYQAIPGLVDKSGDWVTVDLAYVLNNHWTIATGWGHFGTVVNDQANGVWGITTKYEF